MVVIAGLYVELAIGTVRRVNIVPMLIVD